MKPTTTAAVKPLKCLSACPCVPCCLSVGVGAAAAAAVAAAAAAAAEDVLSGSNRPVVI
jgi:tartrate dehydratase alpha subunit/fumarate hydratase class I-like protein